MREMLPNGNVTGSAKFVYKTHGQEKQQQNGQRNADTERPDRSIGLATVAHEENQATAQTDKNAEHDNKNQKIQHVIQPCDRSRTSWNQEQ